MYYLEVEDSLCDVGTAALRGKIIASSLWIRKREGMDVKNVAFNAGSSKRKKKKLKGRKCSRESLDWSWV